eukprot:COSAG03_NODE_17994_length_364_cov_0.584906_1_plen_50_part_10
MEQLLQQVVSSAVQEQVQDHIQHTETQLRENDTEVRPTNSISLKNHLAHP